jgi:hypothetical protein
MLIGTRRFQGGLLALAPAVPSLRASVSRFGIRRAKATTTCLRLAAMLEVEFGSLRQELAALWKEVACRS